ncbi:PE-PGRS family protein [Mycobacterium bohemicum DSM 44277]|uniref:PE-PGRS family protein n=1 Tax=Mycobacterium bohemicum DSM 44277 TaxID=1236609 RepID=A0A0U0WCQ0_MYCBE|nr:PE-PGRS family protein [Mycobacterium bohemicum DSM 44277]
MSFLIVAPEFMHSAASDLANIGSVIGAANAAAAGPTTGIVAAGADEVSAAAAALFGAHAQAYQTLSAQATAFHNQFVQLMNGGAASYVGAEAANAQQNALNAVNAPVQAAFGRPLIGDGAAGTATNPNGGAGGMRRATSTIRATSALSGSPGTTGAQG